MTWQVVMDEDGSVTLSADLIGRLGWTVRSALQWTDEDWSMRLGPVSPGPDSTTQ